MDDFELVFVIEFMFVLFVEEMVCMFMGGKYGFVWLKIFVLAP